ncbi:MAG: Na/Pi cotransporter family protein [Bdellovibrionales bacterium]|nr:Na/Pi cotransporter family protein [Bdellovibrionales bacterium]
MIAHHSILILIIGGTAFFLFGMSIASDNLQSLAANRVRDVIAKLSTKPTLAVFAGIVITVIMQSSGAVTSMLVGLGTAGVITLPQVMGIILGTGVGTTITTQLLSLNIAEWGLPIFAFAFLVHFMTHRKTLSRVMQALMGFGLMFWGLEVIGIGTADLKNVEIFTSSLDYLRANPLAMIAITAIFTAFVHSSAAVVGIAMAMATSNLINLTDAFYWVYGANIGTTATALMAAAGGNTVGKQVAWSHCLHKVVMVGIFYFLTPYAAELIMTGTPARDVANAHLFFNITGTILFFPFIKQGAALIEKIFPPSASEKDFSVKYLGRMNFESPNVVLAHAERECLRMADIVISMIKDSILILKNENIDLADDLRTRDNQVDMLNREISLYITKYTDQNDGALNKEMIRLFGFAADLESAADVIDNSILELARKKHSLKLDFSNEGWSEIISLHDAMIEVAALSVSCFQTQSKDLAAKVVFKKRVIRKMEKTMREAHIERLVQGKAETINTSSIHLDVLSDYRRVVGLLSNHVYTFLRGADNFNRPRGD